MRKDKMLPTKQTLSCLRCTMTKWPVQKQSQSVRHKLYRPHSPGLYAVKQIMSEIYTHTVKSVNKNYMYQLVLNSIFKVIIVNINMQAQIYHFPDNKNP